MSESTQKIDKIGNSDGGYSLLDEVSFSQGTNYDQTKNIDVSPYRDVFVIVGTAKSNDKLQDIRIAQYLNKDVMCLGNVNTYQSVCPRYFYADNYTIDIVVQFKGNAITRLQGSTVWGGDASTTWYMRVYGVK